MEHKDSIIISSGLSDKLNDRILFVDDEPLIRKSISRYLGIMGYDVDTAEDGIDAINKIENNNYDLVLTDLQMPNLDGRELLKIMADRFPEIPKIVLTSYGEERDILISLKAGANDFLYKPIGDFEILLHAVERVLEVKKLNDDKRKYVAQVKQINEIISMLNRGKNTEEVFKALSTTLKRIIPFNRISLTLIDKDSNTIITKMVDSDKKVLLSEGDRVPLETSSLKGPTQDKTVYITNDLDDYLLKHPESKNTRLLIDEGMHSSLALPLIINDETRGFLIFASVVPNVFSNEHTAFLESIVGQISLSIQRGELLADLELHTKELENLVDLRTDEVLKIQKTTIFALSKLAETRDPETGEHLERIRSYCVIIAQILKYSNNHNEITDQFLKDLYDSSILHDIGKVGIPDSILLKPGKLTHEEHEIMKTHTTIGYNSLKMASRNLGENSFLNMALEIILHHHELWSGRGYPDGLKGEDIPLPARIVTICDVYDALTSKRPYKEPFSHDKAVKVIKDLELNYDPEIFKIFIENSNEFNLIRERFSDNE